MTTHARHFILSVDYEIFGDGSGCIETCVLEPARRMLEVAEKHGTRVALFVEALEFAAMENAGGRAATDVSRVRNQLAAAADGGHSLQLHVHPQWHHARSGLGDGWRLEFESWRTGSLAPEALDDVLDRGLRWLAPLREASGARAAPEAFRAGGWCIQPSGAVVRALTARGIQIDSSVAPGLRHGVPGEWYDFRSAPSRLAAWPVAEDVCTPAEGELLEVPIATGRLGTLRRLLAEARRRSDGSLAPGCEGSYAGPGGARGRLRGRLGKLRSASVAMLDVCALPARDLVRLAERWSQRQVVGGRSVPVVAIAHTKNFTVRAERQLEGLLTELAERDWVFSSYRRWLDAGGSALHASRASADPAAGPA